MPCCTATCQKWTVFGFGVFFLVFGAVLVLFTDDIVQLVKDQELNLGDKDTTEYKMWEVTPIPMYIEFHLFNWTNWEDVVKSNWVKRPNFQDLGPYTYSEKHYRKEVVFNDNRTVTYKTQRIWHFVPEMSVGSLDDEITTLNPMLVTVGNVVRFKHPIVRMGVNFFLEEKRINLTITKTVREMIFDGYDDPLLDLFKKLHLKNINIPFDRFAWFVARNGSVDYDGVFNMYDGTDDIRKLGRLSFWNYQNRTQYFDSYCGDVNGTSGELWYPILNDETVDVFASDLCSSVTLTKQGTDEMYGLKGNKFVAESRVFDNGTLHPEMACFSSGEVMPSGVRNISNCKFNAPAFVSFPHFYLADPIYREAIDGMKPNASQHNFFLSIEPQTGIPLQASIAAQINLRLEKISRITLLENVKEILLPSMWFKQSVTINEKLAIQAKLILILPSVGEYTGYGIIGLGGLLMFIFGFITWKNIWKGRNEERLLSTQVAS